MLTAAGAAAPMGAPAGEAQPSFMANHVPNPNPSIGDFVEAYKPVNDALDKAFEQRITGDNAKKVQFELAVVRHYSFSSSCLVTQMFRVEHGYLCSQRGSADASRHGPSPFIPMRSHIRWQDRKQVSSPSLSANFLDFADAGCWLGRSESSV